MANIDWPTTEPFRAVLPYSFGVSTPKSGSRGFYSGENENTGHLGDRFLTSITLPPCGGVQAAQRSAFLIGTLSRGDRMRFRVPHHTGNNGTLVGSLTVSANALAGARSVSLQGAMPGANLLAYSGFESDINADGMSDGWAGFTGGGAPATTYFRDTGNNSMFGQRVSIAGAVVAGNEAGVVTTAFTSVTAGIVYTAAVDVIANLTGFNASITVAWYTAGDVLISTSTFTPAITTAWVRVSTTAFTAPLTAAKAKVSISAVATASRASMLVAIDNVQLEASGVATPYVGFATLLGGDFLGIGGNLLQTAYAGGIANDAGAIVVPLTLPLCRPVTAGAVVTLAQPVGLWQIDTTDGINFDFSAMSLQLGVTIPFRQVIV